jgi:hypothetical protein
MRANRTNQKIMIQEKPVSLSTIIFSIVARFGPRAYLHLSREKPSNDQIPSYGDIRGLSPYEGPSRENPCPASQAPHLRPNSVRTIGAVLPSLFILPFKPLLPLPGGQSHVQESSSWNGAGRRGASPGFVRLSPSLLSWLTTLCYSAASSLFVTALAIPCVLLQGRFSYSS